jgi:hypothetical protein
MSDRSLANGATKTATAAGLRYADQRLGGRGLTVEERRVLALLDRAVGRPRHRAAS